MRMKIVSHQKRQVKELSRILVAQSLKSDEGERNENVISEDNSKKKATFSQEDPKPTTENKPNDEVKDKSNNAGFDLDELFRMDWIPGLLQNESPPDNGNSEMGCSRFSQWFRRDSPLPNVPESGNNSRRSSLHDELIANVLNSVEPQLIIPSPTPNSSDNFFAPISPAISHSSNYSASQSLASNHSTSKDIMEMLQSANSNESARNGGNLKDSVKTVKELEADLKRIVLGDKKQQEERSAFDKLLQHMSDSQSTPSASMSMGPLDKSKALQEQDLLQDILGGPQASSVSPMLQPFQMFKEEKQQVPQLTPGMSHSQFPQSNQQTQNEMFAHIMQQKQQEQHMQQIHQQQLQQQQMQNHMQQQNQQSQNLNVQGFTVDMLAKILGTSSQAPISPSSGLHQSASAPALNRNDPQMLNTVLQYQRQRELLSSILKQQHSSQNLSQSNVLQPMSQRRCPSAKDIPIQQTLGLPTLGISPRQSPLPPEAIGSTIPNQGRIPSPLVFGQQPPALSHAPAPIHPAALVQAMAQNAASSNTLQVQNPVVLQRVPSPQELAVHTQSILQNALIKRKLEEQKENFRKRQEAQRYMNFCPFVCYHKALCKPSAMY
ncbi:alpha-protein kinase 1-like [Stegodyphus dumicola]|uniref:alpha-protein kinase 1-like n=1 Tax=Stegodyphus dumicola TaxID=202533 RepID=UPI0015A941EF|nr:alpha-protein kinase 1-like [Stegodyphus dumicola]